jgi:capsid protein
MSSYSVTGDLSDTSYSSLREGKISEWRRIRIMRDQLAKDFCMPVFRGWLDAAVRGGFLALPSDYESNRQRYCNVQWFGSPMPWVDPLKDISAIAKKMEIGLTTQTEELAERGIDFEDWCAIKAQEKNIKDQYGLVDEEVTASETLPEDDPEESPPVTEFAPPPEPKRLPRKRKKQMRRNP